MTKRILAYAAIAALAAFPLAATSAIAGEEKAAGKEMVWSGWITDEQCGAKNANAEGKACALKCHKAGSKLVLYTTHEKELMALDNQDEAEKHLGHPVTVTGTIQDGTIKVKKIEEQKG